MSGIGAAQRAQETCRHPGPDQVCRHPPEDSRGEGAGQGGSPRWRTSGDLEGDPTPEKDTDYTVDCTNCIGREVRTPPSETPGPRKTLSGLHITSPAHEGAHALLLYHTESRVRGRAVDGRGRADPIFGMGARHVSPGGFPIVFPVTRGHGDEVGRNPGGGGR